MNKILGRGILALIFLMAGACQTGFRYRTGDLIFQDLDCPLCEAIEGSTRGYQGKPVSHMGIIYRRGRNIYVIEAYDGVTLTPLDTFLARSPRILVGRLRRPYRQHIPSAVERALSLKGKPYDESFLPRNDKYYCSELVHDVFLDSEGKPLFPLEPMNFKNLRTGRYDSVWVEYFRRLGRDIPQGVPGSNPAAYSRSPLLKIKYATY
ncbi:MAG: hypothetical protein GXO27_06175 [Chlorobi bacterium]|nr:hypothetical protein [Chlorobiota bacterium]